jgi:hypothetical protein
VGDVAVILEKLNGWLLLASNIAVLAGIFLVAYEVNQNRQAVIGETHQNLLSILHERDAWLLDRDFAGIIVKVENNDQTLSELEVRQFREWIYGKFNVCEHVFDRHREQLMSEKQFEGWDAGCRATLETRQARLAWSQVRAWYSPDFADYFDAYAGSFE